MAGRSPSPPHEQGADGSDPSSFGARAAFGPGDPQWDRAFSTVYRELRRIAQRMLGRGKDATLTPTALVHEAYAKLSQSSGSVFCSEAHFHALCARAMRQIVIDHARRKRAAHRKIECSEPADIERMLADLSDPASLLAMDSALARLDVEQPRLSELIQLRVFAGLDLEQIATMHEVSLRQMQRDWARARIWLAEAMGA